MKKENFLKGLKGGIPIGLGYLAVSFAVGVFCIQNNLTILQAVLISAFNLTSAGQFAAIPIFGTMGSLIELATTQLVINLRYSLMSVSLGQKLDNNVKPLNRLLIAFFNTDEIFAVAVSNKEDVSKEYMYGLGISPFLGWTIGTLLGAVFGSILPTIIVSALGLAIFAMFVAIVVPDAKKEKAILYCVLISIFLSCLFYYIPFLNIVPSGFVIIICAVVSSIIMAILSPVKVGEENAVE